MMKIKTAGVAGTALLATVMSVGVLSSGRGSGASGFAGQPAAAGPSENAAGLLAPEASGALEEQDDRPVQFTANEHQPSVTLADGTKLTLIAISNGEDGWWHANGTRARAPRHYLPRGSGFGSMSISSTDEGSVLDMALFAQPKQAAGDDDADKAGAHARLLSVLVGEKNTPQSTGIAVNSQDQQQVWRIMVSSGGPQDSSQAYLCIAAGEPEKVGEIRNVDDAWVADDGATKWVTLGRDGEQVFVEPAKVAGESGAISVVSVGGHHPHGQLNGQRLTFDTHALDGAQRLEIYRRPLQVVRLSNLATAPDQKTQAAMAIDDTPMLLMTGDHSITHAQSVDGHGHVQTTVQVGGAAQASGTGAAQTTVIHGHGGASAQSGATGATAQSGSDGKSARATTQRAKKPE